MVSLVVVWLRFVLRLLIVNELRLQRLAYRAMAIASVSAVFSG